MSETRAELYRRRAVEIRERAREEMQAVARKYEEMAEVMERAQLTRGTPP